MVDHQRESYLDETVIINRKRDGGIETVYVKGDSALNSVFQLEGKFTSQDRATLTEITCEECSGEKYLALFATLPNLKVLKFVYCYIISPQFKIAHFPALEELYIEKLGFREIDLLLPADFDLIIENLPLFQKITLLNTFLPQFPVSILKFQSLVEINFCGNFLDHFPSEILQLTQLESINFNSNSIRQFSKNLLVLHNLRSISFSGYTNSRNVGFPLWIQGFPRLEYLDLSWNNFVDMESIHIHLPHIKHLNLSSANLSRIPHWIYQCKTEKEGIIKTLNLDWNDISCISNQILPVCSELIIDAKKIRFTTKNVMKKYGLYKGKDKEYWIQDHRERSKKMKEDVVILPQLDADFDIRAVSYLWNHRRDVFLEYLHVGVNYHLLEQLMNNPAWEGKEMKSFVNAHPKELPISPMYSILQ